MCEIKSIFALYEKNILASKNIKGKGSPEIQVIDYLINIMGPV